MTFNVISDTDDFRKAVETSDSKPIVVFKHSRICSLSSRAYRELQKLSEPADPPVYILTIQDNRPLSDSIESEFEIRHESPQIIVFDRQKVVHHTSHSRITADSVRSFVALNG